MIVLVIGMINKSIGRRIRDLKEKTLFTSPYMASYLCMSHESYENLENGNYKGADEYFIILKLSLLFGVSLDYILGRVDEDGKKTFRNDADDIIYPISSENNSGS